MILTAFDSVDFIILSLALGVILYTIWKTIKNSDNFIKLFPVFFWAWHLGFFYGFIVIGNIINRPLLRDIELIWSSIQRLHGVITMVYMTWMVTNSTINLRNKDG